MLKTSSFTKTNIHLCYDTATGLLGINPRRLNTHTHKNHRYKNIYSSFIYNSSKLERTQMPLMDKWFMVYLYNEIVYSNKKKSTTGTCKCLDESQPLHWWKKPSIKQYTLCDSIHIKLRTSTRMILSWGGKLGYQEIFCTLSVFILLQVYICEKSSSTLMISVLFVFYCRYVIHYLKKKKVDR